MLALVLATAQDAEVRSGSAASPCDGLGGLGAGEGSQSQRRAGLRWLSCQELGREQEGMQGVMPTTLPAWQRARTHAAAPRASTRLQGN